jgi:hypothetical protein
MNDEDIHKRLYDAHWHIVAARGSMNAAMRLLGEKSEHYEPKFEALRADVAKQREVLDTALSGLGITRTEVIRQTGCDGSCSKTAREASGQ